MDVRALRCLDRPVVNAAVELQLVQLLQWWCVLTGRVARADGRVLGTGPWSDVCSKLFHAGPFQSDRARPKCTGRERERRPVECNPEMAGNAQARRRGEESDRNRLGIICITPIHQMDHGLSLAVLRCCLTHTR